MSRSLPVTPISGRRCARSGQGVAGPARNLHRRRLHRRSRPVTKEHVPGSPPGSH
jgi:hypothetical protein